MHSINIIEIEEKIQIALKDFAKESYAKVHDERKLSTYNWTMGVKVILGEMGEENGCDICASGFPERFEHGWLYDLIWYREDENRRLIDIPLIVESEWNPDKLHIKYDFEKLIIGRAALRLMIFYCYKQDVANEIIDGFKKTINGFSMSQTGDRYLFAPLVEDTGQFEFVSFIK